MKTKILLPIFSAISFCLAPDASATAPLSKEALQETKKSSQIHQGMRIDSSNPLDRAATEKDLQINKKIRDSFAGWITDEYKAIYLNTKNGVVVIEGFVSSDQLKNDLSNKIKETQPDAHVNVVVQASEKKASPQKSEDDLSDSAKGGATASGHRQDKALTDQDQKINKKIRDGFSGWITDSYKAIYLNAANGKVTVEGLVSSQKLKDDLITKIHQIYPQAIINVQVKSHGQKFPHDQASNDYDRQLNREIREVIASWGSDDYAYITLSSNKGKLTIEGFVPSEVAKQRLMEGISKIHPVTSFLVRIQTGTDEKHPLDRFETENDRQINHRIRDKISEWLHDDYSNITLHTANGNVSISGSVASEKQLKNLNSELSHIQGVVFITNKAIVKPDTKL